MIEKPRILALIPTLNDDPYDTLKSLMEQTIKPSRILVAVGSKALYQKLVKRQNMGVIECIYMLNQTFKSRLELEYLRHSTFFSLKFL